MKCARTEERERIRKLRATRYAAFLSPRNYEAVNEQDAFLDRLAELDLSFTGSPRASITHRDRDEPHWTWVNHLAAEMAELDDTPPAAAIFTPAPAREGFCRHGLRDCCDLLRRQYGVELPL